MFLVFITCFDLWFERLIEDPHVVAVWHLGKGDFTVCGISRLRFSLLLGDENCLHVVVRFASVDDFVDSSCLPVDFVYSFGRRVVDVCSDGSLSDVHSLLVDEVNEQPALLGRD